MSGPVLVTAASGEPYRGSNEQPVAGPGLPLPSLVPYGYVEEEFFVSGKVNGADYTTSILVRKPKDASNFSGLVALETFHMQGAIPFWGMRNVWLPGGHGYVAIAAQKGSLDAYVKKSNPNRYASLQIPNAQEGFTQAIMTQVGAASS